MIQCSLITWNFSSQFHTLSLQEHWRYLISCESISPLSLRSSKAMKPILHVLMLVLFWAYHEMLMDSAQQLRWHFKLHLNLCDINNACNSTDGIIIWTNMKKFIHALKKTTNYNYLAHRILRCHPVSDEFLFGEC